MDNKNNDFSNTIKFVDLDIEGELQKQNSEGYIEVKPVEDKEESSKDSRDKSSLQEDKDTMGAEIKKFAMYFALFAAAFIGSTIISAFEL